MEADEELVRRTTLGLNGYLQTLDTEFLVGRLYTSRWTCQAVFRQLSPLAQQVVLRMLYQAKPLVHLDWVRSWVAPSAEVQLGLALQELLRLRICAKVRPKNSTVHLLRIAPSFRDQLRTALASGAACPLEREGLEEDRHAPSVEELDQHSRQRWEAVLHMMVGQARAEAAEATVVRLLVDAGLMEGAGGEAVVITDRGYQFLLKRPQAQVWTLLLAYVDTAEKRGLDKLEVLQLLFQLSFLELGADYPVAALTGAQRSFVRDLRNLGLVFQAKAGSRRFYPSRLAISLAAGEQRGETAEGYIVVETNYRIYAYCSSRLQISLLSLFVHMRYRLPNLVVGRLTKQSVGEALVNGITAEQIVEFLESNAHAQTRGRKGGCVPETVADQIRLWEEERNVTAHQQAIKYSEFPDASMYDQAKATALRLDALLWASDAALVLVVSPAAEDEITACIRAAAQV